MGDTSIAERRGSVPRTKFNQIDARHDNIKKAHTKTCKWIINRAEYVDWLNPDKIDEHHGFLWIKGKPGAGKSTLMKFILSNARRKIKEKIIISFFFNARGEQLEKSTTGMYRSLLLQILQQLPALHSVLDPGLVLGIGENHEWSVEALRALFEQAVEGLGNSPVVVFIDALDECDESEIRSMVSSFKSLGNLSATEGISFQVCLASRHYPHITMPKKIELVLEAQEGHEQDIVSYLDSELEIGDSKLAQEVRAQIKEKASGVFMWVVLVSGILQQKYDKGHIHTLKQTLREIPGDLHRLFRDILTRDDTNKDELLLCIQWVLFARSPLKPEQLYFAIRSHLECATYKWDRDEIGLDTVGNFILSSSKGLAEVTRTKKDPTVQFIHESVRDFLLKDDGLRVILLESSVTPSAESHEQLKKCCLEYMQYYMEDNGTPESDSKDDLSRACIVADSEFPFLRYAVQNVLYHANEAEDGNIDQTKFLETFQLAKWIQHNNVFQDKFVRRHTTYASLLYLLAELNYGSLIESHQGSQSCFDIEDERYGAPILAAMATGSRPTVWMLLKRETRDEPETSRLHSLCHKYDVEKKVKNRLGRNFTFSEKWGLIYYILRDDDLIAASFAIASSKANTPSDFRTPRGETPFSFAIRHCHDVSSTFRFLVENGADIESRDKRGRSPLALAAASGNTAAVTFLLGKGAKVAAVDSQGLTALAWVLKEGRATGIMIQSLLSHGDTINQADPFGRTPLMLALNNSVSIMKQLIERGADINSTDDRGQSALLIAVKLKAEDQARLLIDSGACTDVSDTHNHRTVLSYAVTSRSLDTNGGPWGHSVVEFSNHGDNLSRSIAKALLIRGTAVDKHDVNGRTPLSYAASGYDRVDLVALLLSHGADVNIADNSDRTPLSYAASNSDPEAKNSVRLLLDRGAIRDKVDQTGKAALSYASTQEVRDLISNCRAARRYGSPGLGHCGGRFADPAHSPEVLHYLIPLIPIFTLSLYVAEDLEHCLNPDPTRKAAERIHHEVLPKVGGGYDENIWRRVFEKSFFDELNDTLSTYKVDSRRVSRNKYYYDQVIRSGDQIWTLFEADQKATTTRLRPVKSPEPEARSMVDLKARQWSQAGDSRAMEPFTWSTSQALNKVGLEPPPFRIFDKSPLEANVCMAYYPAEDFGAPCYRRDTDEALTRRRKEGYVIRMIWKGDIKFLPTLWHFI
ncbi:ankyrin 3 [Fusarium subglutinans]|uniref:Ankyrin 3 n=1 Tax=Gibberella subglutinans TaxID=42677 RepID=A0A8H5NXH6_GIBSU|nr:ankyrin 3 [Fusarium subglutinans]KAF5583056.1 ankyrin 3 [Fusarium subglutinans]